MHVVDDQEMLPERFREIASDIESELGKMIVGQSALVRHTLIALITGGHVLMEGVPGLGKTQLVHSLSEVLALHFSRIQFTPDLMPADITGTNIVSEDETGRRQFEFQQGPVFTNLLLADEINRATPKTQAALLEAMQERQITVGDKTRHLPKPFFVLATQNPIELEGTYPLPEAQLDRFFFKLVVPFPSKEELGEIAKRTTGSTVIKLETRANGEDLIAMGKLAREVPVADLVMDWAVDLVLATHPDRSESEMVRKYVRWGSSPRGLQSLILASRTRALLDGRYNVDIEDINEMALPSLRHRIFLNFESDAAGVEADTILRSVIKNPPSKRKNK